MTVIFDGYEDGCLKDAERQRRYSGISAPDEIVDMRTPVTMKQSIFLANSKNRGTFIELLKTHLVNSGVSVQISPDDADSLIVREAVHLSKNGISTAIVGEDTDLLVLMTALADSDNEILFVKPSRDTAPQKYIQAAQMKVSVMKLCSFTRSQDVTHLLFIIKGRVRRGQHYVMPQLFRKL